MEEYKITLTGSAIERAAQKVAIQAVLKLQSDDRNRVVEIMRNNKALAALKSKWTLLKAMF